MKRIKLSLIVALVVILLVTFNLEATFAGSSVGEQEESSLSLNPITSVGMNKSDTDLSGILLKYLETLSTQVNASELDRIRNEIIKQEMHNQARIASTKGAVLNFTPPDSLLSGLSFYHLNSIDYVSNDHYNGTGSLIGFVRDAENIEGAHNSQFAHLHTNGTDSEPDPPHGGEAFVTGYMDSTYATGDVYLNCRRGPDAEERPPWMDYVFAFVGNNINAPIFSPDWHLVGDARQVPSSSPMEIFMGNVETTFSCIAIICWSPTNWTDFFNCVEIDCVTAVSYEPPLPPLNVLTISASVGGTTDPEPGTYYSDDYVEVTAIHDEHYVFAFWFLDDEGPYTENPITVGMWDGDHNLIACFSPIWNLTISAGEGGTTDPEPGVHQYVDDTDVEVTADPDQGSSFSYWLLDEEWVYTNETIYFDMDAHRTLEAHFDEDLPTCTVMVYAFEYSTQEFVYPDVYVDGDWAGTAWDPFEVEVGEHDFEVDGNAEFPYGLAWFWFFEIDNDEYEDNPLEWTFNTLQLEVEAVYIASK